MKGLPRLAHVQSHVAPRCREWVPVLLEAIDLDMVASEMGPGHTRRMAEVASEALKIVFLPETLSFYGPTASAMARFAALRVAAGIDPCWCEVSTAFPQGYSGGVRNLVDDPVSGHKNASDNGWAGKHTTTEGGAPVTLLRKAR